MVLHFKEIFCFFKCLQRTQLAVLMDSEKYILFFAFSNYFQKKVYFIPSQSDIYLFAEQCSAKSKIYCFLRGINYFIVGNYFLYFPIW